MNGSQIIYYEHQQYSDSTNLLSEHELQQLLDTNHVKLHGNPDGFMNSPKYLALDQNLQASYYIGADWLIKNELSLIVTPKIANIDFTQMFLSALQTENDEDAKYFSKCYGIDLDKPAIEAPSVCNLLTPLLLIHYISLLERLVSTGLKKDYITIIENLKGKIKGQILFSQQLPQNIIPKREYRTVCRYQTYTEDIPANRLLKKALLFARKMMQIWMQSHSSYRKIQSRINKLFIAFTNVSEDIDITQVQHLQNNKLFKTYPDAVRVAKIILKRYDYSVSNISEYNHTTPPFWIDMSRLYEMYVLNILRERYGKNILFQVSGYRGCKADYLHVEEKLIIDAKYKPRYNYSNEGILPDIREISGYARDKRILKSLGVETDEKEIKCLIIYPKQAFKDFLKSELSDKEILNDLHELNIDNELSNSKNTLLWDSAKDIHPFRSFRKLNIAIPILNMESSNTR